MQLFYQLCGLLGFFIEGPFALFVITIVGIFFTVIGGINHRSIYLEQKYDAYRGEEVELSHTQKKHYFWLKVTGIVMVTGLPALCVTLLNIVPHDRVSSDLAMWIVGICLNLPGIIYCVQAVSVRLSVGATLKLPRYL